MKLEIFQQILNSIKKYQNITLYIHERPDFDALGSAYGFKAFLKEYFPEKKGYWTGFTL